MSLGIRMGISSSSLNILTNTEPATCFPSTKTLVGMTRSTHLEALRGSRGLSSGLLGAC